MKAVIALNSMRRIITLLALAVAALVSTHALAGPSVGSSCTVADPTTTPLNVRSAPNGRILGALSNGTVVVVTGQGVSVGGRGWVPIAPHEAAGKRGWVVLEHLDCGASARSTAQAEPVPALLLLPIQVQKEIEGTRASCREQGVRDASIYDDAGVTRFALPGGTDAVVVNDGEVCGGERIKGANCATGGCEVAIYARARGAWRKVLAGRNDPFLSLDYSRDPPAFRALVVSLYGDAPECPVREANVRAHGGTAWKHGQCDVIARWDGTKFVYRMLVP